jgi:small GTP-binding protein
MLRTKPLTIHVVGDTNTGKTTLVNRLLNKPVEKTEPNVGSSFAHSHVEVDHEQVAVDVWDTPGAPRLRAMLANNYSTSDLLVAVCDVTNFESFEALEKMIADAKNIQPNLAVMLVVNKMDLINRRQVSEDSIERLSASCVFCVRTNAVNPDAVQQFLDGVQRSIGFVLRNKPTVSQDFVIFDEASDDEIELRPIKKLVAKKLVSSHRSYNQIVNQSLELTQGIRQLFHDYAHPPLFAFHPLRKHKARADVIAKNLPLDPVAAREYLEGQLEDLRNSVIPKFDPAGSMARRLQYAIGKLIPLQMDIQQAPKSRQANRLSF